MLRKDLLRLLLLLIVACSFHTLCAQRVAIKTNAVDWLTLSPNLSVEARLSRRFSLDVGVAGNPFPVTVARVRPNNLRFQPELRYWFNRPMVRHFVGVGFLGGLYDVRFRNDRYKGDIFAAGITYGYALVLGKQWNMEATIGVGFGKLRGYHFGIDETCPASPNYSKWSPVPIDLGLSFSYIFK